MINLNLGFIGVGLMGLSLVKRLSNLNYKIDAYDKNLKKLEPLKKLSNAKMVNLIGDQISHYRKLSQFNENEFFFDYLKKEIKEKRKMGHITYLI